MTISDLHAPDHRRGEYLDTLTAVARRVGTDVLLLGGDISDDAATTIAFVADLNAVVPTWYVPGNHDLWNRVNATPTAAIYSRFLADPRCLLGAARELSDRTVLIGHIGWYDYSFAGSEFTTDELARHEFDGTVWQDRHYVGFALDDRQLCDCFNDEIAALLDRYRHHHIVLLTHVVNHREFTVTHPSRHNWRYFNGFLGSERLQQLAYRAAVAICGHVHFRHRIVDRGTTFACACLGYRSEWRRRAAFLLPEQQISTDLQEQMTDAAFVFDVP